MFIILHCGVSQHEGWITGWWEKESTLFLDGKRLLKGFTEITDQKCLEQFIFHERLAVNIKGYNQNEINFHLGAGKMTLHNPFLNTEFFEDLYCNIISLFTMSWNISDTYCSQFLWRYISINVFSWYLSRSVKCSSLVIWIQPSLPLPQCAWTPLNDLRI